MENEQSENLGFTYKKNKKGEILIYRFGNMVTVLRNKKAIKFEQEITDLAFDEQQKYIAGVTGNYKRGNEKLAKMHFRNKE